MDLIVIVVGAVLVFVAGIVIGANNKVSVDEAIASLRNAEAQAKATIDKITAHKAS